MGSRVILLCAVLSVACAQPYPPPGGTPDREAPRLVATKPEQRAILTGWEGPVVFTFDEQLSERGARDAVMVSPETGRPVLERDGAELRVTLEGGWRGNTVYRVIITPGIQDRFSNARREPTELVFSTGPPLVPSAIGGLITDRITGRPLADINITATASADTTTVHTTVTDTAGFFGLRYLPIGRYVLRAFEDRNRNKRTDGSEKQADQVFVIASPNDTLAVQLALITPDTTPARLARADARDSLQIRLTFDDFLDPERPLTDAGVRLFQLPDSTELPGARLMHTRAFDDSRRAAGDTTRRAAAPAVPGAAPQDTTPRPTQELVAVPGAPLTPGTRFLIEVSRITNLLNVPNGGGRARFLTLPRAQRDTTARLDTSRVRRDTVQRQ